MCVYEEAEFLLSELNYGELLRISQLAEIMAGRLEDEARLLGGDDELSEVWIGKRVRFGRLTVEEPGVCSIFYECGPELTWTVLDMRFDDARNPTCKALILADAPVATRAYDPGRCGSFWGGSQLRSWLNGDFVTSTFWSDEAQRIVETGHEAHGGAPLVAVDRVFLLSEAELQRYLPDPSDRILEGKDGIPLGWWLRCDSIADKDTPVPYVSDSGRVSLAETPSESIMAVRPALWVALGPARPQLGQRRSNER